MEYAYLHEEFLALHEPEPLHPTLKVFGKPTLDQKMKYILIANDHILDHICTLLAALRMGLILDEHCKFNLPINLLAELLKAASVIDNLRQPNTEQTRIILESKRAQAISQLFNSWA